MVFEIKFPANGFDLFRRRPKNSMRIRAQLARILSERHFIC